MATITDKNCFRSQGGAVIDMTSLSFRRKSRFAKNEPAGPLQVEAGPPPVENGTTTQKKAGSGYFYD